MTLTLRAVSLNDQPLTQPITAHFDLHGGTIGRADHNTLALPDPERHISREQAEITAGGAGFLIRNVGSSNPIVVRDLSLAHGESAPLLHHDQVRIGRYLLEVIDDAANSDANATTRGRGASDEPSMPRHAEAAGGPLAALSPGNPFADLLGVRKAAPAPAGLQAGGNHAGASPWSARLPDDFDPFAPPPAPPVAAHAAPAAAGTFADLIPSAAPVSLDDMFGLRDGGGDPLAAFLADAKPAAQGMAAAPSSTDPLVLFGAAVAAPPPPPEVAADRTPELRAAFAPPRTARLAGLGPARAEVAPATAPGQVDDAPGEERTLPPDPPHATSPAGAADAAAAWAAFCEGAGVKVGWPEGADPALMRLAGTLLRATIDGTLRLMAVRSATRHELHAQVTMIQARNNNPLKFSPDAQAALEQLLQPPLRGFVPGPVAVTEAMDDLLGHAIGTMAGTRSALEGVLARFTPQALEDKLAGKSMIDSVLPMARKARLWELYLQHYEGIREEAQEDFHGLFGKAFLAAYEQQLEQLRRERHPS
jgi:FHA domain-containing protein